jgi:uncharacterized protein (TIGR03067 family)
VNHKLPPRPDLDQLRRQAKSLLSSLEKGDPEALATIQQHLPAASGLSAAQIRSAGLRLADAQSAIARKTGFASWPRLARHVEQLRALEGTWGVARLEIDARAVPPEAMSASRLLIDGDRFRTESPEAIYEGVFNIDVEAEPHRIDIEFIAGPEAGNWNYGIFALDSDRLDLCLDMTGKGRPAEFRTTPGSGHALESLRRMSRERPDAVTGGQSSPAGSQPRPTVACVEPQTTTPGGAPPGGFDFIPSKTLTRLQGDWTCERLVRDGQEFPPAMRSTGRRTAADNDLKIFFGGQLIIHALVRIDEDHDPVHVDYCNVGGMAKGAVQHGIMRWLDDVACFCMAAPGQPRPNDFECPAGSGRTLSHWRKKK